MARNPISGDGSVLDTLIVKIDVDLSGFRKGIAEAIAGVQSLRGAIAGQVGGVTLGDAMTAALVTPMIVATARIGQMRNELRMLTSDMRTFAMLPAPGGPNGGAHSMGALIVPPIGGGHVIDAVRTPRAMRGADGRFVRGFDATGSGDLRDAAAGGGFMFTPIGAQMRQEQDARDRYRRRYGFTPEAAERYRRRYGVEPPNTMRVPGPFDGAGRAFGGMFAREGARTGAAFEAGRASFPGYSDAVDNLGGSAHSVGNAGRRVAGSRIASMLGLVGLGALMGDLLKLTASLATTIGATLAGAFATLATPLGLVVTIITALTALFVVSNWKSFQEFGEWFAERWTKIVAGEGMGDVIAGWTQLKDAFGELWTAIKGWLKTDDDSLVNVLQFFGETVIRVVNAVLEAFGGILNVFAEVVRAIASLIRGDWQGAFDHLGAAVQQAFRTVVNIIGSLVPEIQTAIDNIATWIENRFRDMGNAIGGFIGRLRGAGAGSSSGMTWTKGGGPANDNTKSFGGGGGGIGKTTEAGTLVGGPLSRRLPRAGGRGLDETEAQMQRLDYLADSFGYSLAGAFERAAIGGSKFADILKSTLYDLAAMTMRMVVIEPLAQSIGNALRGAFSGGGAHAGGGGDAKGGGQGGGFWSLVLGAVGSMFGGMFADGGYLAPGKWGIAGEKGAEIIYGGKAGVSVFANDNNGGGFSYVDRRSFDLRGASVEAVQRLEHALKADRQELPSRIKFEMANARTRGRF